MVFGVGKFNDASHIWLGHTLVAMATKICDFQHKIGYNLHVACAADTSRAGLRHVRGVRPNRAAKFRGAAKARNFGPYKNLLASLND